MGAFSYYEGEAVKKSPMGQGKLFIHCGKGTNPYAVLEGNFNNTIVQDAEFRMALLNLKFKGDVSFDRKSTTYTIYLKNGSLYNTQDGEKLLGNVGEDGIVLTALSGSGFGLKGNGKIEVQMSINYRDRGTEYSRLYSNDLSQIFKFTGSKSYTTPKYIADIEFRGYEYKLAGELQDNMNQPFILTFDNGATVSIDKWEKANGDYIKVSGFYLEKGYVIDGWKMTFDNITVDRDVITIQKTFDNGNTYDGTLKSAAFAFFRNKKGKFFQELLEIGEVLKSWQWQDFLKYAEKGTLTYPADKEYYIGEFNSYAVITGDRLSDEAYEKGTLYDSFNNKINSYINGMDETAYAEYNKKYQELKAADFFKFDDNGNINEFRHTYPNSAVYTYKRDKNGNVLESTIVFPDSSMITNARFCTVESSTYLEPIEIYNNYFKDKILNAPKGPSIYDSYIIGLRTFKDSLMIGYGDYGHEKTIYKTMPNGDYVEIVTRNDFDDRYDEPCDYFFRISKFKKNFGDYIAEVENTQSEFYFFEDEDHKKRIKDEFKSYRLSDVEDVLKHYDYEEKYFSQLKSRGRIYYSDGRIFEGSILCLFKDDPSFYMHPAIYNAVSSSYEPKGGGSYPYYYYRLKNSIGESYNSIVEVKPAAGRMMSADGKLIEIYECCKKLDAFDFAQRKTELEGAIRKRQEWEEEKRQAAKLREDIFGKQFLAAAEKGEIPVGTKFSLLKDAIDAQLYERISYLKLTIDYGTRKCYDIIDFGETKGYIWVENGVVSSVVKY